MGRPSKLSEKQWAEIVDKFDINGLLREAECMMNNERSVTLMLRLALACGDLPFMLGVPAINRHRFEFSVDGGRIDLLLFHRDGGVTIVEVKSEGAATVIAAGIGQLCMYAAALPKKLHKSQQPAYIRRVLCAHAKPGSCEWLIAACDMAGVRFAYLPSFKQFKGQMAALFSRS